MSTISRTVKHAKGGTGITFGEGWDPAVAVKKMVAALDTIEDGHTCSPGRCDVCSAIMELDFELRSLA